MSKTESAKKTEKELIKFDIDNKTILAETLEDAIEIANSKSETK